MNPLGLAVMSTFQNKPIAYDDHGDIPLDVSFSAIKPSDISLYLQLDTRVGRATCLQHCSHCFFIHAPAARNRSISLTEGRQIYDALTARGFNVFPIVADSFANDGAFLRAFAQTHVREYRERPERMATQTMTRGEAWTSGAPLLVGNYERLLNIASANGFGTVTITFHDVPDQHGNLQPISDYPLNGVFPAEQCEVVIQRIRAFNHRIHSSERLNVNIGVTIGSHNWSRERLLGYVNYFNKVGVDVVRFNRFHDHGRRHPDLVLTSTQAESVYRSLKWIHENFDLSFQLAVSEDFGSTGIGIMKFPKHVGLCQAGRQLFAIVPETPALMDDDGFMRRESIGAIAACVDAFEPRVGSLVRVTCLNDGRTTFEVDFDYNAIEELRRKRLDGTFQDGCFAPELLSELHAARFQDLVKLEDRSNKT